MQSGSSTVSPIDLLRCVVAILIMAHGIARISNGAVYEFGVFLAEQGFPIGETVAWILTMMEIVGGLALLIGQLVVVFAPIFIIELIMGIVLVHFREGWFVVGTGTNGMEYSVLLIFVLGAVAWDAFVKGPQPAL
jgi:putative oxidoreductase